MYVFSSLLSLNRNEQLRENTITPRRNAQAMISEFCPQYRSYLEEYLMVDCRYMRCDEQLEFLYTIDWNGEYTPPAHQQQPYLQFQLRCFHNLSFSYRHSYRIIDFYVHTIPFLHVPSHLDRGNLISSSIEYAYKHI